MLGIKEEVKEARRSGPHFEAKPHSELRHLFFLLQSRTRKVVDIGFSAQLTVIFTDSTLGYT